MVGVVVEILTLRVLGSENSEAVVVCSNTTTCITFVNIREGLDDYDGVSQPHACGGQDLTRENVRIVVLAAVGEEYRLLISL